LSRDEAFVLFEWLHRSEDQDRVRLPEHHAGEVAPLEPVGTARPRAG
jgi:hypothetical protein